MINIRSGNPGKRDLPIIKKKCISLFSLADDWRKWGRAQSGRVSGVRFTSVN